MTKPPLEDWRRITYKLARLLHSADQMPASTFSQKSLSLLAELRALDPVRFDREIPK